MINDLQEEINLLGEQMENFKTDIIWMLRETEVSKYLKNCNLKFKKKCHSQKGLVFSQTEIKVKYKAKLYTYIKHYTEVKNIY